MRESVVEKKFAAEVKKRGGLAVKFVSPGFNGVPDRLVLFPGGRLAFVELKAPGKTMRPLHMPTTVRRPAWTVTITFMGA